MQEPEDVLLDYPDETTGSKLARDARERANNLSDSEREQLFRAGMVLIYGGNGDKVVCSRS